MKKTLCLSIVCSLLVACQAKPDDYQVEINDAVKFYTSVWAVEVEASDADQDINNVLEVRDRIMGEYAAMEDQQEAFYYLLKRDNTDWGRKILAKYNVTQPSLSEFVKTENDREWISQDQNTGVHFLFRLIHEDKKMLYEIEPVELEAQHYVGRQLMGEKVVLLYESLGVNVDSLIDASVLEAQKEDLLILEMQETINLLYSGTVSDAKVFAYSEDLHKLIGDGDDDWAEVGYWKYSDGHVHKFEIEECSLEGTEGPYAILKLKDTVNPLQIMLEMTYRDDAWIVLDVLGLENGRVSYAFSDFISMALAEAESESEDEGNC